MVWSFRGNIMLVAVDTQLTIERNCGIVILEE
jgi:hypothetical protein